MEAEQEPWYIDIKMPNFGPRKVTDKELERHNAECDHVEMVHGVLSKMNALLGKNKMALYQSEGEGDSRYTPAIDIAGINTSINNETGLFDLPDIPKRWDENTIVKSGMPFSDIEHIHSFTTFNG